MPVQTSQANVSTGPVAPSKPEVPVPSQLPVAADNNVLFEMDSTLNNLARVARS